MTKKIIVFTDGSCSGNGKANAVGGIGIHFPNGELTDVSKVYRLGKCTNQTTELYAILTALRYIRQNIGLSNIQILIKTDSEYSVNCITKWVNGWIKNGWLTKNNKPVLNRELIESIYKYVKNYSIILEHVGGHRGKSDPDSIGNDKADKLAVRATNKAMDEQKSQKNSTPKSNYRNKNNYSSKSNNNSKKESYNFSEQNYTPARNYRGKRTDQEIIVELIKSK